MPWTETQERAFGAMLLAMGEAYNDPVSTARFELFCRALEDLPFEAVMAAANQHIRESVFFPKPVDLRERVLGNVGDEAELAWTAMLREIARVGYVGTPTWRNDATQRTVEGLFGSWRALCERLPAGGPELLGYRKQFVSLFAAQWRQDAAGQLGPGRAEARSVLEGLQENLTKRGLASGGGALPFPSRRSRA